MKLNLVYTLIIAGTLLLLSSFVWFVASLLKKNRVKKPLIIMALSILFFIIAYVIPLPITSIYENNDPESSDTSTYRTDLSYGQITRNPTDHIEEKISFSGTVIQLLEGESTTNSIRVALNDNIDTIIMVDYEKNIVDFRIIEDDYIDIYGYSTGIITYESTSGGPISIPSIAASMISVH